MDAVQLFDVMGDSRHKKSPPNEGEELVTEQFRRDALAAMAANKLRNRVSHRKKGDDGYLVSNRAELAEAIGTDSTQISRILGAARSKKVKRADYSAFVGAIRRVLDLAPVVEVKVRADRASIIRVIAGLSDEAFAAYEQSVREEIDDLPSESR